MTDSAKTDPGNFFEDFSLGQELRHATPRSVNDGDRALYQAIFGSRFAVTSSDRFAAEIGYPESPLDDLLVFHLVFGKTVPDISLNAIANLGYANCVFGEPVFSGDTLATVSRVIGLREASNRKAGVVHVRSTGRNQHGDVVLDYVRWVLVNKRDAASPAPEPAAPDLPEAVDVAGFVLPPRFDPQVYDWGLAGAPHAWDDYRAGERIDHRDGMTIEEPEHQMATRLYQNTARVHFDLHQAKAGRFGKRIVYGGHIISLARSLSFNGLANAFRIAAINGGRHVNPSFAGDTIYAWSEVLDKVALTGRDDIGALRLRTLATKNQPCADFPDRDAEGGYDPSVVLELDYFAILPRRPAG